MNKKLKFLTSSLCGVILASSLSLMNVQAAPVQNNVKTNIASLSTNSNVSLSADITSNGIIYWAEQSGAADYTFALYNLTKPWRNQKVSSGDTHRNYLNIVSTCFDDNSMAHTGCFYKVDLQALDNNKNVISSQTLYFYYNNKGDTFNREYLEDY